MAESPIAVERAVCLAKQSEVNLTFLHLSPVVLLRIALVGWEILEQEDIEKLLQVRICQHEIAKLLALMQRTPPADC